MEAIYAIPLNEHALRPVTEEEFLWQGRLYRHPTATQHLQMGHRPVAFPPNLDCPRPPQGEGDWQLPAPWQVRPEGDRLCLWRADR